MILNYRWWSFSKAGREPSLPSASLRRTQAESKTTAISAQTTPTAWSFVIDSCKTNGTNIITTSGYRAVSGETIDAFPPLFRAANRAHAPRALRTPLNKAHVIFHAE